MNEITNSITSIIKGGSLEEEDFRGIIKECLRKIPAQKVMPSTEIPTKPLPEREQRHFNAVHGIRRIAEERLKQFAKGHPINWDSVQEDSLLNAVIFCLTEDPDYFPKGWDKAFFENVLVMEEERKIAIAGAFLAAYLDVKQWLAEKKERDLEDFFGETTGRESKMKPVTGNEGILATLMQDATYSSTITLEDLRQVIERVEQFPREIKSRAASLDDFGSIPEAMTAVAQQNESLYHRSRSRRAENRIREMASQQEDWGVEAEEEDGENEEEHAGLPTTARPAFRRVAPLPPIEPMPIAEAVGTGPVLPSFDDLLAEGDQRIVEGDVEL